MADDITLPGTGTSVATDDVSGVHFQKFKLDLGADGVSTPVTGSVPVSGNVAHDAADSGNPIKIGGYANSGGPSSVADGDRVNAWFNPNGALNIAFASVVAQAAAPSSDGLTSLTGLYTNARLLGFNGTTWDRIRSGLGGVYVQGSTASDSVVSAAPILVGARASTAVPTPVSADGDVVHLRALRTGALAVHVVDAAGSEVSSGVGNVAHDAVDSGNPIKIGGKANDSAPTQVANADRVDAWLDRRGALFTRLTDSTGAAIATGVQYVEDAALGSTGQGTLVVARRDNVLSTLTEAEGDAVGLRVDTDGALWVSAIPHSIGRAWISKTAQYTVAQTGTALWTPAAGKKIVVTRIQIQSGGTTAGTCIVWFGASGDTTYTRGTDLALFDGEFAPSSTSKPGYGENAGGGIVGMASTADHILRVTTTNAQTVTITVWGYEV